MNRTQTGVLFLESMALTKLKVTATLLLVIGVFADAVGPVARRLSGMERRIENDEQAPKQAAEETKVKADTKKPGATDLYGDPLPPGALARMGTVQLRHGAAATAFSPDGNLLATLNDKSLRFWSMASGKLLHEVKDPNYSWGPVMFSPDGKWLASRKSKSLCLLDAATGKPVRQVPAIGPILDFSPDSKLLATSANDPKEPGSVFLWHTATAQQAFQLKGPGKFVYSAAFTPDGRTLVTLSSSQEQRSDKVICHWDVAAGTLRKTLIFHLSPVPRSWTMCLSPDGQTVAFAPAGADAINLRDTDTGQQRTTLKGELAAGRHLAFTRDSRTLAAATWFESSVSEGTLALWDVATGQQLRRFAVGPRAADGLQFAPDGRTLLTNSDGPRIYLWDTATGEPRWQREAHEGHWITLSFTPDGHGLVSGSNDGTIRVWDAASGRQMRELTGHRGGVGAVAVLPDGQTLLSGGCDGVVRLQELETGKQLRRLVIGLESETLSRPAYNLSGLGLAADGRTAALLSSRSEEGPNPELSYLWDLATGRELVRSTARSHIYFDAFSPDAQLMAGYVATDEPVESDSPVVVVEEVGTGRRVLTLPQPDNGHNSPLVFSPDGQTLATSTSRVIREWDESYYIDRHAIRLWELSTGRERLTIINKEGGDQFQYTHLAFAPDGRVLATARQDHMVQLWDVASGQELLRRPGYDVDIPGRAFVFAPDGRTLATGHVDSTILLWDLAPETWRRQRPSGPLEVQELQAAWADLASADARKAHVAIWKLAAVPRQAVPLLGERLRPAPVVSADRLRQLLSDLNSSQVRQQQAATKQLADLEEEAEPAMQDALKSNPSPEQRERIEPLLVGPRVVRSPDKLRTLRAIQVLEQCNLPEARQVLTMLARGSAAAKLTQEANAALERLAKRTDSPR